MKKTILSALIYCSAFSADAQISLSPAGSPSNIANLLTGSGVTISNVVLLGDTQAFSFFTASNTPLNMAGGLMLSTGLCSTAAAPNTIGTTGYMYGTTYTDPNLTSIESQLIYDVAMIEFDCVPSDDTLFFNYLFGSEEYPEFVSSAFNDGFGLFVSGPNPAGGNYVAANVGLLPNGTPVAINNVNNGSLNTGPCTNCSYYTDNTGSAVLEFDGLTTNLTAVVPVVPQSTYHLKIAVADAGDGVYDSGVFLQAGSFRSGNLSGIQSVSSADFGFWPNPANQEIVLNFARTTSSESALEILDQSGKIIRRENVSLGTTQFRCDVSSLSSGSYFLRVLGSDGVSVRPLVIMPR